MNSYGFRGTTALLALSMLLGSLAWYGCKDGQTSPEPSQGLAGMSLVADPVVDALSGSDGQLSPDPARRTTRLTEILGLSPTASRWLSSSYTDYRGGLADLTPRLREGELGRREAHELATGLRHGFEAELTILLTESQYDHLQQLRQLHHRQPHAHRDPARRWVEWLHSVQASPAQAEAVIDALDALRDGIRESRRALRDGELDLAGAFAAARLQRAEFDAELHQLLTPWQEQILLTLRPDVVDRES